MIQFAKDFITLLTSKEFTMGLIAFVFFIGFCIRAAWFFHLQKKHNDKMLSVLREIQYAIEDRRPK